MSEWSSRWGLGSRGCVKGMRDRCVGMAVGRRERDGSMRGEFESGNLSRGRE